MKNIRYILRTMQLADDDDFPMEERANEFFAWAQEKLRCRETLSDKEVREIEESELARAKRMNS